MNGSESKNAFSKIMTSPILWGAAATAVFYGLIKAQVLQVQAILHYFISPTGEILTIPFVEILMFFIGFAALAFKFWDIRFQAYWVRRQEQSPDTFFSAPKNGFFQPDDAVVMVEKLDEIPAKVRSGYFIQRLKASLDFIIRNHSARGFTDEMKYLSDLDAARMAQSYAFIRVIIWAIPILGFLGTVMGITLAIGGLGGNLSDTEQTLPKMISDLSFAFDTTALALSFSIVLMFFQFYVDKLEHRLLDAVDVQTNRELAGRFEEFSKAEDGMVEAVRTQGMRLISQMEKQSQSQTEMWENSFRKVETEWTRRLEAVGTQMGKVVEEAFTQGVSHFVAQTCQGLSREISAEIESQLQKTIGIQWKSHVAELKDVQNAVQRQCDTLQACMNKNNEYFSLCNSALAENGQRLAQFAQTVSQLNAVASAVKEMSEATAKIAEGSEKIVRMENVLTQNLSTLQGARDFEHTVSQLAAAVTVLNTWLNEVKAAKKH
ncbi:MAG: MotA/TolQ/ExbB proton channel family protein [Thermoguttaceae bacterium]|nr:MotA/TolQ/ExbB proton channel family protein [Thermoguttaceae bacterium]MDO4858331.1 MotA/TolQ/ExbB proton channel family protein [Thermoguttaceae bacterium]